MISVRTATKICGWRLTAHSCSIYKTNPGFAAAPVEKPTRDREPLHFANTASEPEKQAPQDAGVLIASLSFGFGFLVGASSRWVVVQTGPEPPNQRAPRLKPTPTTGSS